jgi:hypothetical protein
MRQIGERKKRGGTRDGSGIGHRRHDGREDSREENARMARRNVCCHDGAGLGL